MLYRTAAVALAWGLCGACATSRSAVAVPTWVMGEAWSDNQLCGLGVAGAGYDPNSPYPRQRSQERAVLNLAGILGTEVQQAMIEEERASTQSTTGPRVDSARRVHVDESLVAEVAAAATVEFWLDKDGTGPYAQKDFTYAHACLDASHLQGFDAKKLRDAANLGAVRPDRPPAWLTLTGPQPGGKVCATGYSLPAFFADQTFGSVVDDVRAQLAVVMQGLVGSYFEELAQQNQDVADQVTVATTDALAKGVIVTHYWHDRDGTGPRQTKQSTYGWGCVYPVDVMRSALQAAAEHASAQVAPKVAQVHARAAQAFADLDAEEAKHGAPVAQDGKTP